MSTSETIESMKTNLSNAYDSVEEKGGKLGSINLARFTNSTETQNGITFTHNADGTITTTGTSTWYPRYNLSKDYFTLSAGTYTLAVFETEHANGDMHYDIYNDSGSLVKQLYGNMTPSTWATTTFTLSEDTNVRCSVYVGINMTFTNENIKFMVLEGSYTSSTLPDFVKWQSTNKNLENLSTAIESIPETEQQFEYNYDGSIYDKIKKVNFFNVPSGVTKFNFFQIMGSLEEINNFTYETLPTSFSAAFQYCTSLKSFPNIDLSNVIDIVSTFNGCKTATDFSIISTITDKCVNWFMTFANCTSMTDLPSFNAGGATAIQNIFQNDTNLANFGGMINLGKAYTQKTTNYSSYTLDLSTCTALTHDSLVSIINNLYDLNLTYNVAGGGTLYTQSLVLGSTNLAKLTDAEIAVATAKGWTVS